MKKFWEIYCPSCFTLVIENDTKECHCPECGLWYTSEHLFNYIPLHLRDNVTLPEPDPKLDYFLP